MHFSECCLSGYAGVEMDSFESFDWAALIEGTLEIQELAKELSVWVVVGSAHRLSGADSKPHNCLYIINDMGEIVDRYDKLFAVGSTSEDDADLAHYSPGSHFSVFDVKGVRCGALICHDFRYPQLYSEYFTRGVQLMLHSYHNGHATEDVAGDYPNNTHLITVNFYCNGRVWVLFSIFDTRACERLLVIAGVGETKFAQDWRDRNSYVEHLYRKSGRFGTFSIEKAAISNGCSRGPPTSV